jgi:hypothetical protein
MTSIERRDKVCERGAATAVARACSSLARAAGVPSSLSSNCWKGSGFGSTP